MQDNPYQSPSELAAARPRRRLSPPPVLHYGQIVGAVMFFGSFAAGFAMRFFPNERLLAFFVASVVNLLLGVSICLLLERRRRREERNAPERPDRDLQAWRRH